MGSAACGCCESSTSKTSEIHILSPKSRFSFFSFGPFSSRKIQITEDEIEYRIKLLKLIKSTKSLKIKVLTDGAFAKGTTFIIHPSGLENSSRDKKDGYVYFGHSSKLSSGLINDICIPCTDLSENLSEKFQCFMLYYSIERDSYLIKDLNKGQGPYIKLQDSKVIFKKAIKTNSIIGIGETYLTLTIEESHVGNSILTIKKFSENENGNIQSFDACDYIDKSILIGRKKTCDLSFDDFLVSKIQCEVRFDINEGWVLKDVESANGTWMYLKDEAEVYDGMIFKVNNTLFQVILM